MNTLCPESLHGSFLHLFKSHIMFLGTMVHLFLRATFLINLVYFFFGVAPLLGLPTLCLKAFNLL